MDENDEQDREKEEVKSKAIVKYSAPKPATFAKLQCNTDLNLPPSNWLSSSADSYGLQRVLYHQKGFSSFRMAHMFPDNVGEVDVVSDAENIKNLLKIPYSKGHISMIVHRVKNTLLVDEFDIYKHLLKTSETEWEWLKKFFSENIDKETYEEDKQLYLKERTHKALKQKSLVSKFLYHSLVEGENADGGLENIDVSKPLGSYSLTTTPQLPDPSPDTECPNSHPLAGQFNRNVIWTFEDIEMLLGTDMPIFGGGTHPCISLRLSDMSKPISVLTGIDYWLDNLMSNVPELVMCYHLNGIVQKYELIKTEELPRLDNSRFSPKLIRDVAQSILSFLKSNATKAGHTYWLFKGKGEEVVKLYDLTSLCSEEDVNRGQNPFTIPVAMLLYRVARNMKHSCDSKPQPGTIRMLLKNCIKLLPEEKYPEIATSAHYMLSDLYVPADVDPEHPDLDQGGLEDDVGSVYEDDDDLDDNDSVATLDLTKCQDVVKSSKHYKQPPPITGSIEERCMQSIGHVTSGLSCLQFFPEQTNDGIEGEIPMAKPFEAIPMPYAKLDADPEPAVTKRSKKKDKKRKTSANDKPNESPNALLVKPKNEARKAWPCYDDSAISWKTHLKTLLFEKAVLVYATLVEQYFLKARYGSALRVLALLARCQLALDRLHASPGALRLSCLVGRVGDACLMVVQNWKHSDAYREQLHAHRDDDVRLLEKLELDERTVGVNLGDSETRCVFVHDVRTIEQMLVKAVECYDVALKMSPSESLSFRLANGLNELASYHLNVAKQSKSPRDVRAACDKAEPYLVRSLEIFERLNNDANIALLNSNVGHMHRMLAYAHGPDDDSDVMTAHKQKHYHKAIQSYKRALRVLGQRKHCPGIWDAVTWELSTALFTAACILYENPPAELSKPEAEREVLESLQRALEHCDLDEANPKYPLYQYRAAMLHFKMASVWHRHAWDENADSKRHAFQLATRHYDKAVRLLFLSGEAVPYLTAQMQKIHLYELTADGGVATQAKLKNLHACLEAFVEMADMLQLVIEGKVEVPEANGEVPSGAEFKTLFSVLKLVKDRLQEDLKGLVKLCVTKPTKNGAGLTETYKACYKATFGIVTTDRDALLRSLHRALVEIGRILKDRE
ncbi:erythroid differentiation-related factor 1 [Cylas formicarius]|uniref:erythroid differentiation-related factor 1 n=1 Tax=Cylas formicarius TaxID=197179 RepID=UPI002958BCB7|nr:erythroid differentiation-related factor 1 [Cylas formicarius]